MKKLHLLYTLLFGVAVVLFFGMAYPHHLHYQEQFQLFLFDCTYVWEIVKLPGGVADLLGRFCTQFFLFAWVGALIIAILLSAVQILTLRLAGNCKSPTTDDSKSPVMVLGWSYGLTFVPAFLLWLFLLDENALLGGVWAVLLTLLASWGFGKIPHGWMRRILLIVAIPILYWIAGPVCVVFFLLQIPLFKGSCNFRTYAWYLGVFVLLAIMIVILTHCLPVPARNLWFGVHYHRYPMEISGLLWIACLSFFVFALIARFFQSNLKSQPSNFNPQISNLISFVLVAICMGLFVWKNSNFKAEKVMQYDFMACHQQWNRILKTINAEKPNNQIGVTVQNLALAKHGMLLEHMLEYNQNGISGLLPDVETDATSPMPTAEAFYQLGMINVAQRTVFEAQEAILDFQKSGRCYKRLAQTNLINGQYEVARKYLMALQKTLFYREWANETLPLLGNEEAINKHPEYGPLRKMAYKDNFYFSDHVTPDMLESLYFSNTDNFLAYQYLLAYYLLTGDREGYNNFIISTKQ